MTYVDASFKGILMSGGEETFHYTGRRVAHSEFARAGDKNDHLFLLSEFKKGEIKFQ